MPHGYGGREMSQLDRIEAKIDALLANAGVALNVPQDAVGYVTTEMIDTMLADDAKDKPGKPTSEVW